MKTHNKRNQQLLLLIGFIIVLSLLSPCVRAWDFTTFINKLLHPNACPARADYVKEMEHVLRTRLIGQEYAYTIPTHFLAHEKKKALTFHFTGDHGIGKTLATRLIAQSIFTERDFVGKEKGLLYIHGEMLRGDEPGETAKFRNQLRQRIVEQLSMCPFSLIVIDEAQFIHESTLSALKEFMDDPPFVTYEGQQVRTNEAIFIIVSDFGSEAMSYGMTKERVQNVVYREMERLWADPKQRDLIQYIIPFVPLREDHLRQIAELQLKDLLSSEVLIKKGIVDIQWDETALAEDGVPGVLASLAKKRDLAKFGRSIENVINSYVRDPLLAKLYRDEHLKRSSSSSSDKFVVRLGVVEKPVVDRVVIDIQIEKKVMNVGGGSKSSPRRGGDTDL